MRIEQVEQKINRRDKKRSPKMKVDGRSVFLIDKIRKEKYIKQLKKKHDKKRNYKRNY